MRKGPKSVRSQGPDLQQRKSYGRAGLGPGRARPGPWGGTGAWAGIRAWPQGGVGSRRNGCQVWGEGLGSSCAPISSMNGYFQNLTVFIISNH